MRFAQERLGKEQQSALTTALKVAEKARSAQLLRVVRTAHCPSLAAFLASWRTAAVAEQVARNYYHAAAVAGNYYYAQGAVSGATFDLGVGDGDGDDEEEQAGQGGRSRSRTRRNHRPKSAPAEQQLAAEQQAAEMGKRRRRRKARHKTQGGNVLQFY